MFTHFEEFAATQMLGHADTPPRRQGRLHFDAAWQRSLFGMALALSKQGHFEWEDFRQHLIRAIGDWEQMDCQAQPSWDYYERFLQALVASVSEHGVVSAEALRQCLGPLPTIEARAQVDGVRP